MSIYRCAVIGNPIAHSQSPNIHATFAKERGIALQYDRILAESDTFATIVAHFFRQGGRGLNITVPFKETAFTLCQHLTPYAKRAGAVNTLWMADNTLCGDNTDGRGLVTALTNDHHTPLTDKTILLLGAGGAARGVILPILEHNPACLHIHNRTHHKAVQLANSYEDERVQALMEWQQHYDIIINATSSGLSNEAITLPTTIIHAHTLCYDMMYGKTTPFMQWAQANHAEQVLDGYSMLVNQALLSFNIWFDDVS